MTFPAFPLLKIVTPLVFPSPRTVPFITPFFPYTTWPPKDWARFYRTLLQARAEWQQCTFDAEKELCASYADDGLHSTTKNPDDVVITLAIRTPLAKGKKGGFKDTDLDFMVYALLKKVIEQSKIDPNIVEDICMGNVRL